MNFRLALLGFIAALVLVQECCAQKKGQGKGNGKGDEFHTSIQDLNEKHESSEEGEKF